jgi:hypothetical protein
MEMGPNILSFPEVEVMATMINLTLNPYAWSSCIMRKFFLPFTDDFKRSTNQILLLHITKIGFYAN